MNTRPALHRSLAVACAAVLAVGFAACGGDDSSGDTPAAQDPAAVTAPAAANPNTPPPASGPAGPLTPGQVIQATTGSPKPFAAARNKKQPIVVAFVLKGIADDDYTATAVAKVRGTAISRGVTYFVYNVDKKSNFGDLANLLGVTGTPSVTVIGRDGRLVNSWTGLVDTEMLTQAVSEAKDSPLG